MSNISSESQCIQYLDNSTIYRGCIKQRSQNTNLVFNSKKIKYMLSSISRYHSATNLMTGNDQKVQRVEQTGFVLILTIILFWNLHTGRKNLAGYSPLRISRYASYQTRKNLVKPFNLSKVDLCNATFKGLQKYQKQTINFYKHTQGLWKGNMKK